MALIVATYIMLLLLLIHIRGARLLGRWHSHSYGKLINRYGAITLPRLIAVLSRVKILRL